MNEVGREDNYLHVKMWQNSSAAFIPHERQQNL